MEVLQQAAGPENLVIGMRSNDDQASGSQFPQWTKAGETARVQPGSLIGPGVPIVDD
jgi:hypothetical protein